MEVKPKFWASQRWWLDDDDDDADDDDDPADDWDDKDDTFFSRVFFSGCSTAWLGRLK